MDRKVRETLDPFYGYVEPAGQSARDGAGLPSCVGSGSQ